MAAAISTRARPGAVKDAKCNNAAKPAEAVKPASAATAKLLAAAKLVAAVKSAATTDEKDFTPHRTFGLPATPENKALLEAELAAFVGAQERAGALQHTPAWYAAMDTTIGGSELSVVEGINHFSKFSDIVARKTGLQKFDGGAPAMWWGTLFEDVAARVIELDCEVEVTGAEICVQAIKNHRNSPDGYSVAGAYWDEDDDTGDRVLRICENGDPPELYVVVLWELKCPFKRRPDRMVCPQYRSQIWSGLTVSPVADVGVFVDSAIRKCSRAQLTGDNAEYDNAYHRDGVGRGEKGGNTSEVYPAAPYAWGLIAVYAPRATAPAALRFAPKKDPESKTPPVDVAEEAVALQKRMRGTGRFGDAGGAHSAPPPLDFGGAYFGIFDAVLRRINEKMYPVGLGEPALVGGRGAELSDVSSVDAAIDAMRRPAERIVRKFPDSKTPDALIDVTSHYYLLGYIPWKLMEINYVPEFREPGYHHTIVAHAKKVFDAVDAVRAHPDGIKAGFEAQCGSPRVTATAAAAEAAAYFDSIS